MESLEAEKQALVGLLKKYYLLQLKMVFYLLQKGK
jgi:hypothetical protein